MKEDLQMQQYIGTKIIKAEPAPAPTAMGKYPEGAPGYKVEYEDGYISWSPKAVFEEAYRPSSTMSFGLAVEAMRKGLKVARAGWNGKGMYLELQVPDEHSKMTFPYPFFTIPDCREGTRRIPYASTIVDIMSDDWEIVR